MPVMHGAMQAYPLNMFASVNMLGSRYTPRRNRRVALSVARRAGVNARMRGTGP